MTIGDAGHIGTYEIINQVGTGGMATVYRAQQPKLGREVAIKVMHKTLLEDPAFIARFEREARIVARLDHPNIVPVYDFDELNGQPYLVMKYIQGRTLKDMLRKGALPLAEIRRVMPQLADALHYAHLHGILHRDIKPSNVIVDARGIPYLTDFGLARVAQQGESTMSVDTMLGTPQYISPEQALGNADLDARTDVYSLGVVLYELVVGRVPFLAESAYAIVHKHIYAAPPEPYELNPDVTEEVNEVLLKALGKDPDDRYQTPLELMQAFEQAVGVSGLTDLADDRQSIATQRSQFISQHTPAGSNYNTPAEPHHINQRDPNLPKGLVQVPVNADGTPLPAESFREVIDKLGDRLRQGIDDVKGRLGEGNLTTDLSTPSVTESGSNAANRFGQRIKYGATRFRETATQRAREFAAENDITPGTSSRPNAPGNKPRRIPAALDDYSTDDEAVRRRVRRRIQKRRKALGHTIIFLIVISLIAFFGQPAADQALQNLINSTEMQQEFARVTNGMSFLDPLIGFPIALFVALSWGGGLISHWLHAIYNTAGPLDRRRRRVVKELEAAYGADWREVTDPYTYARVRRRVERAANRHLRLMTHFASATMAVLSTLVLWPTIREILTIFSVHGSTSGTLWASPQLFDIAFTHPLLQAISEVPVPGIVAIIMGVTVLVHGLFIALSGMLNAEPRETIIAREIKRERELSGLAPRPAEFTNRSKAKRIMKEDDLSPRLTGDGEFTESFVDELTTPSQDHR